MGWLILRLMAVWMVRDEAAATAAADREVVVALGGRRVGRLQEERGIRERDRDHGWVRGIEWKNGRREVGQKGDRGSTERRFQNDKTWRLIGGK